MEAKHTPGPWYPLPGRHNISIRYKTGDKDIPMINVASVRGQYSDGCPYGTSEGNARLILAAPELLEACQAMIEWDDREQDHAVDFSARTELCRVAFDKARAAIAKATQ